MLLGLTIAIQPAFAERVVSYEDSVDMKKENLRSTLVNLQDYPKIFPQYVKSVNLLDNNQAEITVVSSVFSDTAQVKYYYDSQGKFILEALSGKAKGSKIIIALTERSGYDGTPNGGATIKMDLTLNISGFIESIALGFVGDGEIRNGMDIALYGFEKFAKEKYLQSKNPTKDVTQKEASTSQIASETKVSTKELGTVKKTVLQKEAAQKLDPKKEAEKLDKQTKKTSTDTKYQLCQKYKDDSKKFASCKKAIDKIKLNPSTNPTHN